MHHRQQRFRGWKSACVILGIAVLMLAYQPRSWAEELEENPAGFSVESVQMETQVDKLKSYFYFQTAPSETQIFHVKVKSLRKEPVTVLIEINDARSSSNGVIDYASPEKPLDESLTDPLSTLVKVKDDVKDITVENFEEKLVSFEVTPPDEPFEGVKAGAVLFTKKEEKTDVDKAIASVYQYKIAIMIREDDKRFDTGSELVLKDVGLSLYAGQRVIASSIQNPEPKVLKNGTISGYITKKGDTEVLNKAEIAPLDVAPNSTFDFNIPLGLKGIKEGVYTFHGEAKDKNRSWTFEQDFDITKEEVAKINKETTFIVRVPTWVPWVTFGLGALVITNLVYLFGRAGRWETTYGEKKKRKKKSSRRTDSETSEE